MSTAHRPTWDPAQGKQQNLNTRQYSSRQLPSHTKLKFRGPGQTTKDDVARRDLKRELEIAEEEARNKRRKLGEIEVKEEDGRRKAIQEALELDRDDSDGDENSAPPETSKVDKEGSDGDDNTSDDDSEEEDETQELLRELEKIKRERAAEKEAQEREKAAGEARTREEEIALGNPLLNLQAALGGATPRSEISSSDSFQVKRRWDDDVIFKNQAKTLDTKGKNKEFVNDLLRTEFHKKFLKRYIA